MWDSVVWGMGACLVHKDLKSVTKDKL
jgi:hypothetical protein